MPARQLLRELQFSQLNHPNLIVCYGAYISSSGDSNGNGEGNQDNSNGPGGYTPEIHILMELGEGGALDSVARQMKTKHANRRIGEKVIARLAEGVLKGLDYMHSNKVTHRDIKPSNILLTKSGVVKLCDFGVSGVLEASLASTFTGTSWYMAVSFVLLLFTHQNINQTLLRKPFLRNSWPRTITVSNRPNLRDFITTSPT